MWEFFEAKLNKKLSDIDSTATTSERVSRLLLVNVYVISRRNSFFMGFQETNSFIRAYSHWKGSSPSNFREMAH